MIAVKRVLKPELLTEIAGERSARFDNKGDRFYDLISALHKSVRGSAPMRRSTGMRELLPPVAIRYMSRVVARNCFRRCRQCRPTGDAGGNCGLIALLALGLAEGERAIAQAIVYRLRAKSNAVYTAFKAALADARERPDYDVPVHLRNAPTKLMKEMGYGQEYRYAHDEANAYAAGEVYFPPEIAQTRYYFPTNRALKARLAKKLARLAEQDQNSPIKRYR